MRVCALVIEHMAWLYAEIIRHVMVQGFKNLRTTAGSNDFNVLGQLSSGTPGRTLYIQDHNSVSRELSAPVSSVMILDH
jgi:hypothetical protein